MTRTEIDHYLGTVDVRIEARVKSRVPGARLIGYRKDLTGASVPQFFASSPSDRAALRSLGLEIAPLGLAMARISMAIS